MDGTLTGRWIGRYDYGDGEAPVPFEAEMMQDGMTLRATTVEPNTFHPSAARELKGCLTGWIVGREVRMTKTYSFAQLSDPEYVGHVDPAGRRIAGRWSFEDMPGVHGTFTMTRKPVAEAKATARATAEADA